MIPSARTLFFGCLLTFAGCAARDPGWTRSELYFGLSKPTGGVVSADEWERFVLEVVTPRFPDGLAVDDASGQYRDAKGQLVREGSKVLIIMHPANPEEDRKLQDIRRVYQERFAQESVLQVDQPAKVRF